MNKKIITAIIISTASTVAFAGGDHKNSHSHGMKQFSLIDTNSDESLSTEEVINFHTQRFAEMDADNDGLVSKSEIKSYRKQQRRDKKGSRDQKGSDTES
jgi:Ca2+-binding EF-hand superfamily protein